MARRSGSAGSIPTTRYGVESIESVEIVRGPSSALYGSEAIGGVVNIRTRESTGDVEADATLSYGASDAWDATARAAVRPAREWKLAMTGGYHGIDPYGARGGSAQATPGSARAQWSLGGNIDYLPSDHHRLRARADYVRTTLEGVDGGGGAGLPLFDRIQVQEQLGASFEHRFDRSPRLQVRSRITYGHYREQYALDQRGDDALDEYEDNREHVGQASTVLYYEPREGHGLTVGLEELVQGLDSERITQYGRRARFAVFGQYDARALERGALALRIVPGVRFDHDSQFGARLSPKLAIRFDPAEGLVMRAAYGRGIRAPSFQQLLFRFENPTVGYVVAGNSELGPETSHGVDFGIDYRPSAAIWLSTSFFRNDLRDMIAVVTVDDPSPDVVGTLFSYENIATAWTMGLESSVRFRANDVLALTTGYTFTETWDGENERRLEGPARHRLSLGARLAYEPWSTELVARGVVQFARTYYVDDDGDGVPEQTRGAPLTQLDLRLAKRFTRHFEIFAGVDNLLDAGDRFAVLRPLTFYGGLTGRY